MNGLKEINKAIFILCVLSLGIFLQASCFAQIKEPKVQKIDKPKTPLGEGYSSRAGGTLFLNNFGPGLKGFYSHAISPFTELTFGLGITGIRDVTEQRFTNFFTGRRVVPNKFNRALGIPLLVGIKQRIFPRRVADNFRFFVSVSGGPALGLVYPYFNDADGNGYRSLVPLLDPNTGKILRDNAGNVFGYRPSERIRGFFGGLGNADSKLGGAGELKVGIDFGQNFKQQFSLSVGYFFYYFSQGLQILEPKRPVFNNKNEITGSTDFNSDQRYFGTPVVTFSFSGWW